MATSASIRSLGNHTSNDAAAAMARHVPDTSASRDAIRNAAVAMVLNDRPGQGLSALFIQRAEHPDDPWSGQMAFPGGRFEPYDRTLVRAAIRETREEVGLPLTKDMLLGRLSDVSGGRLSMHRLAVSPFVFFHPGEPELQPNYEVANTVWVPVSFLGDSANITPYVFPADPEKRVFPSWHYEGYTIWGLTYRIIGNYLQLFDVYIPGEPAVTEVE
jgi:8-oxo-dGTP pyrophosphatase MutT (NUDIX family)